MAVLSGEVSLLRVRESLVLGHRLWVASVPYNAVKQRSDMCIRGEDKELLYLTNGSCGSAAASLNGISVKAYCEQASVGEVLTLAAWHFVRTVQLDPSTDSLGLASAVQTC